MKKKSFFAAVQRELLLYFLHPAMYIALAVFLFSCACNVFYLNKFFITGMGSSDLRFFFSWMPYVSILCIPALTMALWTSEEDSSASLPVSTATLVTAKWFASLTVFSFAVFASLAIAFVVSFFGTVELSLVITATCTVLLFGSALCAFGQLSALMLKNQAAAFFVTALLLTLCTVAPLIPLNFTVPVWFGKLCNFISFAWHFDAASKGIIDTRDIFFYIIITLICLVLSVYIFEKRKYGNAFVIQNKKRLRIVYTGICFLLIMILWNTQIFYARIDFTQNQRFTLSDYSKNLTDTLETRLSITYYVSSQLQEIYPNIRDVEDFLFSYAKHSADITVRIIDPKDVAVKTALENIGVVSQYIPITEENRASIIDVYSAVVLEYAEYTEVIPFVIDMATLEFDIAGRIQSLTGQLSRSAFILVGNDLSLEHDYPNIRPWLEDAGFAVKEIMPDDITHTALLDIRTPLVLLGSSALLPEHIAGIENFIESGGNVFFSVSPIDINIDTFSATSPDDVLHSDEQFTLRANTVFSLLNRYGLRIENALIHDTENMQVRLLSNTNETLYVDYPFFIDIRGRKMPQSHPLNDIFEGLTLFWPTPIIYNEDNYNIGISVMTSQNSWLQFANEILAAQSGTSFITDPFFEGNLQPYDEKTQSHTVAIATDLAASNDIFSSRLVVVSDQYFLSRAVGYVNGTNIIRNFDFLVNSLLWLQKEDDALALKAKTYTDYSLHNIADEELFLQTGQKSMIGLSLWFLLMCFLPYGFVCYTRQRHKKIFAKQKKQAEDNAKII